MINNLDASIKAAYLAHSMIYLLLITVSADGREFYVEDFRMFVKASRVGSFGVVVALLLTLLGACGGTAGTGAGVITVSPEDRVKAFMTDTGAALGDPKLSEPAKQEEWADKLSKYFLPADQAKQKEDMKKTFVEMGAAGAAGPSLKIEGVTTEKVSESGDNAEVKITGGKMTVTMGDKTEEVDLSKQNPFSESGNPKLKKVDGVWYIVDTSASP